MKARLHPKVHKAMVDELMAQIGEELEARYRKSISEQVDVVLTGWMCVLAHTLHDYGWGQIRLERFFDDFHDALNQLDINANAASCKPTKGIDYGDSSTAIAHLLRDLNESGIDYRAVMNVQQMFVGDTDVCVLADRISRRLPRRKENNK